MKPKEKANQLFLKLLTLDTKCEKSFVSVATAKRAATIAVDEIFDSGLLMMLDDEQYWHDVKQEIQKI